MFFAFFRAHQQKGVFVYLGRTNADLCPVSALLGYLWALFRFSDGKVLSRPHFVERVRSALRLAGVDQAKYCSHSFRIGAAAWRTAPWADGRVQHIGECGIFQNTL